MRKLSQIDRSIQRRHLFPNGESLIYDCLPSIIQRTLGWAGPQLLTNSAGFQQVSGVQSRGNSNKRISRRQRVQGSGDILCCNSRLQGDNTTDHLSDLSDLIESIIPTQDCLLCVAQSEAGRSRKAACKRLIPMLPLQSKG